MPVTREKNISFFRGYSLEPKSSQQVHNKIILFGWSAQFRCSLSPHLNFEESCREENGVSTLTLYSLN